MAKQFADVTPQDALSMSAMLTALIDYRTNLEWDTQAEEVIRRDQAYAAADVVGSESSAIKRTISLPIIRNNNNRKVAAIGSVNVKPVVYSEVYGGDGFAEVRAAVLRWGVRVSGLQDAVVFTSRHLVSLGQGVFQLVWDANALDGQGAPVFEVKDPRNIYVDGRRRQWDINRECRIIAEKQRYTRAECEQYWPEYFESAKGGIMDADKQLKVTPEDVVPATSPIEGGEVDLLFVEYVALGEGGSKVVKAGIFDPLGKEWIKKPYDTKLGMFSYIINGLPPDMGRAYPIPPNLTEHELARLVNLAYTLYIHTAFKNADGPVFYKADDPYLAKYFKTHSQFELGEHIPTEDGKAPEQMKLDGQDGFLNAAQTLHAIANDSSDVQAVQRGEAPRGVSSGRALGILTSSADLSMEQYRQAVKRAFVQACTVMDRMLRIKVTGYRELITRDAQQVNRMPVNVAEGTPQYAQMKSAMDAGEIPAYETARMYKDKMYVGTASIEKAREMQRTMKITDFKTFINDITVGGLEVDVDIEPISSRQEKKQQALVARQMGAIDSLTFLTEQGYDNPTLIAQRLVEENQMLQIGQMMMENPQLMQAVETLQQDPLLMKLVTDPRASGAWKLEMAKRALKNEMMDSQVES